MIDLHTHTTCSDGLDTPNTLLKKAELSKIEILSITDHNNALSYSQFDSSLFSGKIIKGCEMATSFEGNIIEILGYGINPDIINNWFNQFYSEENLINNEEILFYRIKKILDTNNIKYTKNLKMQNIEKGISKKTIYYDIIKYEQNRNKFPLEILSCYKSFFRKGLSNPKSILFCNEASLYPSLQEIIDLIKSAGGLTFLAHLFEYKLDNHFKFLDQLLSNYKLDGLECYHSSFTKSEMYEIAEYANRNKYYISGGSDYHGKENRNIYLGTGKNNLHIDNSIIENWINKIN